MKTLFDTKPLVAELLEDFYTPIAEDTIDVENGVIRNVKILGSVSENGVTYSRDAMREAVSLYEGQTVNVDHPDRNSPTKERGWMEGIGFLEGVRYDDKADGLVGNFHYYKTHPYAETLLERARRNPKGFGLSHNADGEYVKTAKGTVIEKIRKVRSVDVVGRPATTKGLFESKSEEPTMKKYSLRQLVESFGSTAEKKNIALLEDVAVLDREVELEEDKASLKSGFTQALLDSRASDADESSRILAAESVLRNGPPKEEDPPTDKGLLESLQAEVDALKKKNAQMELDKEIAVLCESESFKPDEFQRDTLMLLESADKRIKLIHTWKDSGKPRHSGRRESLDDVGSYEEERAKLHAQS
ncbi:MAG TPA: hypothetical protein VLA12_00735 [Planctomycetaceae bacterium]|nr:hypothetical protein [Planctomycetaceae bacterium]